MMTSLPCRSNDVFSSGKRKRLFWTEEEEEKLKVIVCICFSYAFMSG